MNKIVTYGQYPWRIVFVSNLVSLGTYLMCLYILLYLHYIIAIAFLFYIVVLEFRLLRYHCVNCWYYGKRCGFGRGNISAWFFKKGDSAIFIKKQITWKSMLPELLTSLVPVLVGIVLLILNFDFKILLAIIIILIISTWGNGFVRGKLVCKHCKQRECGCPAYKLFEKK